MENMRMIIKQNVNRILPAMLALLLCLSLAACGGDSKNSQSTKSTKTGKISTVSLGGDFNRGSGNGTRNEDVVDETVGDISEYVGLWEYVDEDVWLRIYEGETWEFLNNQEVATAFGSLWVDKAGITLYFDDTGDVVMQLDRTESGDLIDNENGGKFVSVDSIQSSEPYFTSNGLAINAEAGNGTYLLKNGVCSYANLGEGYTTGDCYWEVTIKNDQTHDGIREIQFDALCYVPQSSLGAFNKEYIYSTCSDLYDFYTGKWFTDSVFYGNSDFSDNHYVHTIDWNGQSETIEFAFSAEWQSNVGNWAHVLTKSYVVYLPEGYDGLVFAAEPKQDNYKDYETNKQMDSIMPEANIMDLYLLDPYGCLFFKICN